MINSRQGQRLKQDYLTRDMAKAIDLDEPPYKNLKEYGQYKKLA